MDLGDKVNVFPRTLSIFLNLKNSKYLDRHSPLLFRDYVLNFLSYGTCKMELLSSNLAFQLCENHFE